MSTCPTCGSNILQHKRIIPFRYYKDGTCENCHWKTHVKSWDPFILFKHREKAHPEWGGYDCWCQELHYEEYHHES